MSKRHWNKQEQKIKQETKQKELDVLDKWFLPLCKKYDGDDGWAMVGLEDIKELKQKLEKEL